eukprot:CAMPEP_0168343612 /NCGR_PEP_ID=MMETSP0213-20121227/16222_1 /TAXON_ID=151035 /ORGANISM="Euplotes harpa, Strain FSP1.4" /LENGTH=261 /DNA_ID=CAMNT_0008350991 /DNA_START=160 /DNA_END=945 /DNA_ORIENTATION=+
MGVKEIMQEPTQANDQGGKKYSRIFGKEALLHRQDHEIHFPIRRGIIEDFDTMNYVWEDVLRNKNMGQQTRCDVLMTDSPLNHKDNKVEIAKNIFDLFKEPRVKVESLTIMNSAVLSLFASGRTSGVVMNEEKESPEQSPIFEGYALPHAIKTINLSGQDVTKYLFDSLVSQGLDITDYNLDNVREMKEQMCSVALDYDRAIRGPDPLDEEGRSYELPDGNEIIQVDHKTRFTSTELLFNPDIAGIKGQGITQIAYDSIQK